jgi:hypothetical protein
VHHHRKQRGTLLCLDTGEVPADLISPGGTIPVRITVNGHDDFVAD